MTTVDEINNVLTEFSKKIDELHDTPAEVDRNFDTAAIVLASREGMVLGVPGQIVGGIYGAITNDDFSGYLGNHREEIKNKITELLNELSTAIKGTKAPIAFVQTSGYWLDLKGKIGEAQNDGVVTGNTLAYWTGGAADKYNQSRLTQDIAMDSAKTACDTLHTSLAAIATSSWEFYTDIVKELSGYLIDFGASVTKIATGIGAPWAISDIIDLLAKIIKSVIDLGKKLGKVLIEQKVNIDKINGATDHPKGFVNNKWPQSASTDFDTGRPDDDQWKAK
ncbi:hypothetical protein OG874_02540 [Nocardia sp. NBC_00565]|uniref:hypothetical protein n=1 Tax=Nocardia sp. NBC_00565 TaxID=2975993 RepID=UPI002E805C8F|nr:hypothetical protein [Nocardia sp. NBC_00565]WUC04116.1 hypothetical protein OG874_02540 [Nocardia sp. NBC_00565]